MKDQSMTFVLTPPPVASVAVEGTADRFPVRRIFCVGRNYAAHAREMGKNPDRDPPFFFTKPADAVVDSGETVAYPPETENFHYEAELVVAIGTGGRNISEADSLTHVWGYAVGNDLTRRDLQLQAREQGRPWDWGKAFDRSAVIGPVHPVASAGHPSTGSIRLLVNDAVKQDADLAELIWSVPEIISILSHSISLAPGDLIMTGTPAGVGPLVPGDRCVVEIAGLGRIETPIGPKA
jgi:fumarylpyruvate hydrolase